MPDLHRALEIAVEAHRGQRQRNGLPYALHPIALMQSLDSAEARMAALLHDVVEDTPWTLAQLEAEGFPAPVIAAIDVLTHRDGVPYEDYVERIAADALAVEVKLADLADNMDLRRIPEPGPKDLERLARYHRAWRRLSAVRSADRAPDGTGTRPERIAFRMRIKPGTASEYRARHDALWPELGTLLREAGISDYSIWLDPETDALFATLVRAPDHAMDALPEHEIMRRWWAHMAPLMDVNADDSPVVVPLERVFRLD